MYSLDELCVEITGQCLMNCMHCSSSCDLNKETLSFRKIKDIFEEAKCLGVRIIELSGGEPLLHPQITNIIEEAKKSFEVRLYTSGFVKDNGFDGIPEEVLRILAKIGIDKIIFNLQGANAIAHEKITQTVNSFDNVINSIKSSKAIGLWTGIHFVPMKPNYKELWPLAKLSNSLKVDELAILRFVSQGRGKTNKAILDLSQEEFNELLRDIVITKKAFSSLLTIRAGCPMNFCSLVDRSLESVSCKAGLSTLSICFDGKVAPCPAFKQSPDFCVGNIKRESLSSIWENNSTLSALRNLDYLRLERCSSCGDLYLCKGRCAAQRFYQYNDIYQGPDPLCPYQKPKQIQKRFPPKELPL
jgi:radical SAM protein with 4Fe4S-binding SPASM domain